MANPAPALARHGFADLLPDTTLLRGGVLQVAAHQNQVVPHPEPPGRPGPDEVRLTLHGAQAADGKQGGTADGRGIQAEIPARIPEQGRDVQVRSGHGDPDPLVDPREDPPPGILQLGVVADQGFRERVPTDGQDPPGPGQQVVPDPDPVHQVPELLPRAPPDPAVGSADRAVGVRGQGDRQGYAQDAGGQGGSPGRVVQKADMEDPGPGRLGS